jgi:signal transduction histidine kinase/DNA-binding response OmpR family regulator
MLGTDKTNILIVDDMPEKVLVLTSILEELGQNLVTARSGEAALRRVLEYDFAVILLDVNMPGMDGLETAALIRRRKKSAHTPIIFITAFADEMHTAQGYSLGAVDYILAPVVPNILRTKVRVFVELHRMTQQIRRQADERVALATAEAARAAAEEANRRSMFLADASKVLSSSLDYEATLRGLLRLAVPYLADLAAITLTDAQGHLGPAELAWVDAARQPVNATVAADALHPDLAGALLSVLASGGTIQSPDLDLGPARSQPWSPAVANGTPAAATPDFVLQSLVLTPLRARGRVLGVLCLAMGASERQYGPADLHLAEDLAGRAAIAIDNARLYGDVQRADVQKNEFLSMLAHELRNPLAPIRNAVYLLRQRQATDPQLEPIQDMVERQVQHLVRLVDDLLDVSRITRGKIRLQKEAVELSAVTARALELSRPFIEARGHELTVSLPEKPIFVEADPVRLAQVLGNLLNNAAKYTEEGGRIWLTAERDRDEAVLRVRDTGVGIPQEMLHAVFDLFTQVERSLDRSHGGLGIGLTLVRRLVELHGGRVQANSPGPNQGSDFEVRLPILEKASMPEPLAAEPLPEGAGLRHRILVVDDNRDAADSLALVLRLMGHEVHVCHDGAGALAATRELRPEVVLLDIGLPEMDGYEVARRLRTDPELNDTLLVAITGYGQEQDLRRSREVGFDHHLVKPVDPATLAALFAAPVENPACQEG